MPIIYTSCQTDDLITHLLFVTHNQHCQITGENSALYKITSSRSVYCVALGGKKSQMLPHFQLCHPVAQRCTDKVGNMGAHLRTFLFPTIPKSFPYSDAALMAKSRSQILSFKSVTNKQKTKIKNIKLPAPSGVQNPSPTTLAW